MYAPSGDSQEPGKTEADTKPAGGADESGEQHSAFLPIWGEEARMRGYDLPEPFGIGLVYYTLHRDIAVSDVRLGRNGATPASLSDVADFGTTSSVDNVNVKFDAWLFPFLNVYAIAGYVKNDSTTRIDLTVPPLLPNQPPHPLQVVLPTRLDGTVTGYGMTLAGGYKQFFAALDANHVDSELGFDERISGSIVSLRVGWNGAFNSKSLRTWISATKWNLFTTIRASTIDTDGSKLALEIDQGPKHPYTYGIGASYTPFGALDVAVDAGTDFHGGWYCAIVPVIRF